MNNPNQARPTRLRVCNTSFLNTEVQLWAPSCFSRASTWRIDSISETTYGSSAGRSLMAQITSRASSMRPRFASHRGDSGSPHTINTTAIAKINCMAIGVRHDAGPSTKENPKSIQYAYMEKVSVDVSVEFDIGRCLTRTIPTPMKRISQETSLPRHSRFDSSLWYIGTVLESIPVPRPVMKRPTIKCASVKADVCSVAPTMMRPIASQIMYLRPSMSPTAKLRTQPKSAPRQ
jgi:hypothetical protein